jgi:hypothetical protein
MEFQRSSHAQIAAADAHDPTSLMQIGALSNNDQPS